MAHSYWLELPTSEDCSIQLNVHGVLAGTSDPSVSLPLSVSAVNGSSANVGHAIATTYGKLTLNANGSYSYSETASLSTVAAFDNVSFTVSDVNGNTTTSTLSILVYNPNEALYVGSAGGSITTGSASSVVDARADNESVVAGSGSDTIFGGNNEFISAGNGQDVITTGTNAVVTLGNGDDTVTAGAGSLVMLGNGNDTVAPGNNSVAILGNGNDTVIGGANDLIFVGSGQDQLVAGFNDSWSVGAGKDTIAFNAAGFGSNTIAGFNPSQDVLTFNASLFQNYAAVHAATTQVGSNAVITDAHGDQITVVGVNASQLTVNNVKIA
jgi:VCBS repeat-containing protein